MRKGLIPIVGGAREAGTSMLLEDVACATHKLGAMSKDLVRIFKKYGYNDACLMGHALEGNLHLIFNQSFKTPADIKRFEDLFEEICHNVAQARAHTLPQTPPCATKRPVHATPSRMPARRARTPVTPGMHKCASTHRLALRRVANPCCGHMVTRMSGLTLTRT
jgi:hypothetical protein